MIQNPNSAPQRRGANVSSGVAASGFTLIVAAGANTTGIILRSVILVSVTGGGIDLHVNGNATLSSFNAAATNYMGPGILIPAGQTLGVFSSGTAGSFYNFSWDAI